MGEVGKLIERLVGADSGSRELDAAIWESLKGEVPAWPFGEDDRDGPWIAYGNGMWEALKPFTTSLDAALSLAERLGLSGGDLLHAAWRAVSLRYRLHIEFWKPENGPYSAAVALALCAAILRAKEQAS